MILKPCPFCRKEIPRAIMVCPYCHRDEHGQPVVMDSTLSAEPGADMSFQNDLQELANEDPFTREQAVLRVAQRGFGVVQELIRILSDFAKPGLAGVAQALGKIGDRRAIPVLAQAAKMGDEDLRLAAVWALAQFHEPEVLPVLMSEAERPHPVIQSFLANVLGSFQDSRVVPILSKLVGHPSREVAFQAACALGETGDREGIPALQKTWRRRDALIRAASAASLRRLGGKPAFFSPAKVIAGVAALAILGAGVGWLVYK
jgi:HEAT repeat protein